MKNLKKYLSLFLVLLLFSCFSITSFASEYNSGILTLEENLDDVATGEEIYPSWSSLYSMVHSLPSTPSSTSDSSIESYDNFVLYFASGSMYDDGSAKYNVILWDSSTTYITMGTNLNGNTGFYSNPQDGYNGSGSFDAYVWDKETSTWNFYKSYIGTVMRHMEGDEIYSSCDISTHNNESIPFLSIGVSSAYKEWLSLNDPDYVDSGMPDVLPEEIQPDEPDDYGGFFNTIIGWLRNIWNGITSLGSSIGSFFSDLGNLIILKFESLREWIVNLGITILDGIKSLFIPRDDFMDEVILKLQDELGISSTYSETGIEYEPVGFLGCVLNFGSNLNSFLQTDFKTPPSFLVRLEDAEGKYFSSVTLGSYSFMDLSWFSRYRVYTDAFLSFVMWISFIWLLYKRLPDIINGSGMITDVGMRIYTEHENRLMAEKRFAKEKYENSYEAYKEKRHREEVYASKYEGRL